MGKSQLEAKLCSLLIQDGEAHRAGSDGEPPKVPFTTVCPGGYFSLLFYRLENRDSRVNDVADIISASPSVLGHPELTPESSSMS